MTKYTYESLPVGYHVHRQGEGGGRTILATCTVGAHAQLIVNALNYLDNLDQLDELTRKQKADAFLYDVAIATAAYTDGILRAIPEHGKVDDYHAPNAFDWEAFNGWLSGAGMIETRHELVAWAKKDAALQHTVSEFFSFPGVWSYEVSEEVGAAAVKAFIQNLQDEGANSTKWLDFDWQQVLGDECLTFVCRDADHNREEVIARIQEVLPEWQRPPKPNTVHPVIGYEQCRVDLIQLQQAHIEVNNDLKILIDAVLNKPPREIAAVTLKLADKYGAPTEG